MNKDKENKVEDSKAIVEKPKTLSGWLQDSSFKAALRESLPKHLSVDRYVRVAVQAATRVPKLRECDPRTVMAQLINLSSWGLELNGRDAHLLPFFNNKTQRMECQLIVDYKGLVDVVLASGEVKKIDAEIVHDRDEFEYNLSEVTKHKINFKEDRGEPYAAYVKMTLPDGTVKFEIMSKAEIQKTRECSKAANAGPWVSNELEMWKKTVFRKSTKWLKLSRKVRDVVEADDTQFEFVKTADTAPKFEDDIVEVEPVEEKK